MESKTAIAVLPTSQPMKRETGVSIANELVRFW
jgi:hypothetical protein